MKKLFLGFIITTVLISQAFAQSSTGTEGGGGVYKTSTGQYVTLPEMGLLIGEKVERGTKTYSHYYTISPNTLSEINNIIETVNSVMGSNLLKYYVDEYLDRRENIIKIKDVKSEIYKKIKEEYQSVLQKYGYTLENEKFVLPAYTVPGHYVKKDEYSKEKIYIPGKTYILPDFELLTEKQQAKIIIHEVNMERPRIYTKSKEEKLEDVLAVDVQINQMLNDSSKVDWLTALTHFYKAELSRDVTEFVLLALQKSLAHPIYQDDIIMKGRYFSDNMYHDNMWRIIDSSLVQVMQEREKLSNNFAQILEGVQLNILDDRNEYSDNEKTEKFCANVAKSELNKSLIAVIDGFVFSFTCVKNSALFATGNKATNVTRYAIYQSPQYFKNQR